MRVALKAQESLCWIWAVEPADLGSCTSVEVREGGGGGGMCDCMFVSHVNAVSNYVLKNCNVIV